ncbi:MAG TPA: hypothetical protein VGO00_08560 [Kofleriaceae bacterium]|jgi:hypothetical protein|nr:hypothetical protein [Kofleriaceae bacterium]
MRFALVLALIAGCARDVTVRYPSGLDEPTSSLVLLLSDPAHVSVAVNGLLVVEDVHTQRVVIDKVPVGTAEVVMTANGADKSFKVWVGGDHATTVPLGAAADAGPMSFVKTILAGVISVVVYALIR